MHHLVWTWRREQKNKLRREAGRDEGNIDKMKHIQTNRDNNINEVEPINMLFTTHIDSPPSYREPSIYAAHSPTANKEFNQNTIKNNSDKNNEESVEQQQGNIIHQISKLYCFELKCIFIL